MHRLIEASVDWQHGEILCVTDASIKWQQRRIEDYRSGKSDMNEIIEDFDDVEKLSHRLKHLKNKYWCGAEGSTGSYVVYLSPMV